jgi:hypothetical protein
MSKQKVHTASAQSVPPDQADGQAGSLDHRDFLWKAIGRFDFYINSVNVKAAFIIAFNVFVITGIVLKWADLLQLYGTHYPFANLITTILLAGAALAAMVSLVFTFMAVNPFLKSPREPSGHHSAVFFGHVVEHADPEGYLKQVKELDGEKAVKDLSYQAHALARGTVGKFAWMKRAIGTIVFAEFPIIIVLVVVVVCVLIARQYAS